jgi:hypothetical protein
MDKELTLSAIEKFLRGELMTEDELEQFKLHVISFGLLKNMDDEVLANIRNANLENYQQMFSDYTLRCAAYALNIHYGI